MNNIEEEITNIVKNTFPKSLSRYVYYQTLDNVTIDDSFNLQEMIDKIMLVIKTNFNYE